MSNEPVDVSKEACDKRLEESIISRQMLIEAAYRDEINELREHIDRLERNVRRLQVVILVLSEELSTTDEWDGIAYPEYFKPLKKK